MNVKLFESNTHVFVIKLWAEDVDHESGNAIWRGHITHVPSQQRKSLESLFDIPAFILLCAKDVRFQSLRSGRLRQWFARRLGC